MDIRWAWGPVPLLAVLLAACNKPPEPPKSAAVVPPVVVVPATPPSMPDLKPTAAKRHAVKSGCKGDDCPVVDLDLVTLGDPALDTLVEKELAGMSAFFEDKPRPAASLAELTARFWKVARPQWGVWLTSRVVDQHHGVLTLQLDAEIYNGGAHSVGVTRSVIVDRNQANKRLSLSDLLLPGQDSAFWALVKQQHARWIKDNDLADADSVKIWPFIPTDNIALTAQGVRVKYQNYDIGPYAFGQPEFTVPYAKLGGILKPDYLR